MDLHVVFLPFLAPGHMIPMVDLARLFADRGARATVVTTTANAPRIKPTIDRANSGLPDQPIELQIIQFPSEAGLPQGHENITALPTPDLTPGFVDAIQLLERPFRQLLAAHHPDFIVSDVFYPWTVDLGIPRIAFHGTSFFSTVVPGIISRLRPHDGDEDPFVVPAIPHRIEMTRSQLPSFLIAPEDLITKISESHQRSYGIVMNTFYEMEPEYADRLKASTMKVWHVGPLSLCYREILDRAVRGDQAAVEPHKIVSWLDIKTPGSVLYVCFGSLGKFTSHQLSEIATGLEASGHPFLWVVSKKGGELPEGFEERVVGEGKGMIIKGWAPQIVILNHPTVGGFMTHCGWNSCLEGASAGVPMITWPLFAEQFFNERLLVDVLRIGVSVGSKVCSAREEERNEVRGEEVRKAVEGLMGGGEEADARRKRAREIGEKARAAVEEGGSSFNDMSDLIRNLIDAKTAGIGTVSTVAQV